MIDTSSFQPDYEAMVRIAQAGHAHQTRSGGVPYWHHVVNVANILGEIIKNTTELGPNHKTYRELILAALGHDLYEDTSVTRENLRATFGDPVDQLIWELTNEGGDANRAEYVQKMSTASEEARLIKLADLADNTMSVAYNLPELGIKWTQEFYLPIVEEMFPIVKSASYTKYPQASRTLIGIVDYSFNRLYTSLNNCQAEGVRQA